MRPDCVLTPSAVERKIREAFADLEIPEEPLVIRAYQQSDEGDAVRRCCLGRSWQAITRSDIQALEKGWVLTVMTPVAWRYYLPAWMTASIDAYAADFIPDYVVRSLAEPGERRKGSIRVNTEKQALITDRQAESILTFLRWIELHYGEDADESLDCALKYWGFRCNQHAEPG